MTPVSPWAYVAEIGRRLRVADLCVTPVPGGTCGHHETTHLFRNDEKGTGPRARCSRLSCPCRQFTRREQAHG